MIKFTVYEQPCRVMQGVSKAGKPYNFKTQSVYAHVLDSKGLPLPVPKEVEIILDPEDPAYPPGEYQLSPASVYVSREGRLAVAPKLVPLKRSA